jgi:hypothetical protein
MSQKAGQEQERIEKHGIWQINACSRKNKLESVFSGVKRWI